MTAIRVFVGSCAKYEAIEPVVAHSIRRYATAPVDVTFMRPAMIGMAETGCTTFTNTRYAVPELCDHKGYAIYIDVDMILLADIGELYSYRRQGRWCRLKDDSNEVMVIDCSAGKMPAKETLHEYHKGRLSAWIPYKSIIPMTWNCEDVTRPGMKLLHFTDLSRQPWFTPDRSDPATDVLREMQDDYKSRHNIGPTEVQEGVDRRATRNAMWSRIKGKPDSDTERVDTFGSITLRD